MNLTEQNWRKVYYHAKNACFILYTNIDEVEIFYTLHDAVPLLTERRSEHEAGYCEQRLFRKFWTRCIQIFDQKMDF